MKIALIGYGRMGKTIHRIAEERGHEMVMTVTKENKGDLTADSLRGSKADVAIEFTYPDAALSNIRLCFEAGVPVVSGTTAWLDQWQEALTALREYDGSFLYASNFSVGVNLFFALNQQLAALMSDHKDYTPSIHEVHHTGKLDAPSGTAITLAEGILGQQAHLGKWHIGTEADGLAVTSERIDPAPGTHHVKYTSKIDDIELIHTAKSRDGFATGAVLAAEYLSTKKGLHTMADVLGLEKYS